MLIYLYFSQARSLEIDCSSIECPTSWQGDKYCDEGCMSEACNYDSSTKSSDQFAIFRAGDCSLSPCQSDSNCTEAILKNSIFKSFQIKHVKIRSLLISSIIEVDIHVYVYSLLLLYPKFLRYQT